jgi:hypothetical protein
VPVVKKSKIKEIVMNQFCGNWDLRLKIRGNYLRKGTLYISPADPTQVSFDPGSTFGTPGPFIPVYTATVMGTLIQFRIPIPDVGTCLFEGRLTHTSNPPCPPGSSEGFGFMKGGYTIEGIAALTEEDWTGNRPPVP